MAYEKETYIENRMGMKRPDFLQYSFRLLLALTEKEGLTNGNFTGTLCFLCFLLLLTKAVSRKFGLKADRFFMKLH